MFWAEQKQALTPLYLRATSSTEVRSRFITERAPLAHCCYPHVVLVCARKVNKKNFVTQLLEVAHHGSRGRRDAPIAY